jgi:general secretion pathway protein E
MSLQPVTDPKRVDSHEAALEQKLQQMEAQGRAQTSHQLANTLGLPFSDLHATPIDIEALSIIPEAEARKSRMAAIYRNGPTLVIALLDPNQPDTKSELEKLTQQGFSYRLLVTTSDALERIWQRYSQMKETATFEVGAIDINDAELDQLQSRIKDVEDIKNQVSKISATKILEILIAGALKTDASDIHLEPESESVRLRYRLDGLLHDIATIDPGSYAKVLNRVKILSKLKLNVHKTPQDGRFTIRQQKIEIEVRVSILPSEFGETIVLRLLDPRTMRADLKSLGMRADLLELVQAQLKRSTGAILTTGPTGAGKTTTLYAFVNYLNSSDAKIITIEDPIEYHVAGISQTQVDVAKEYTFANGLRAIVRQDPDIILVGEIRDRETAEIALNAALTGHLVFSTIHTNDAAGTIPRLIDLGIRSQVIAPAMNMAMGQRLLRRLCQHCRVKEKPTSEQLKKIRDAVEPIRERFKLPVLSESTELYFPNKCSECNQSGYKGRVGVYELFTITREMEELVLTSPAISAIRDLAVSQGMVTMVQDGFLKLLEGTTSLEEIERVLG